MCYIYLWRFILALTRLCMFKSWFCHTICVITGDCTQFVMLYITNFNDISYIVLHSSHCLHELNQHFDLSLSNATLFYCQLITFLTGKKLSKRSQKEMLENKTCKYLVLSNPTLLLPVVLLCFALTVACRFKAIFSSLCKLNSINHIWRILSITTENNFDSLALFIKPKENPIALMHLQWMHIGHPFEVETFDSAFMCDEIHVWPLFHVNSILCTLTSFAYILV